MPGSAKAGLALLAALQVPVGSGPRADEAPRPRLAQTERVAQAARCGWYVILGCSRSPADARRRFARFSAPGMGGGAGIRILDTNAYPNFTPGLFCIADGPYPNRDTAASIAWREDVPDAYVKNGC
jgi:hypothetical protein